MSALDERTARMALCALLPMGNLQLYQLVEELGASEVWEAVTQLEQASRWGRKSASVDPAQLVAATRQTGSRFLIPGDLEWPEQLSDLATIKQEPMEGAPPFGLWAKGSLAANDGVGGVGIVGSRAATSYGTHVATDWGSAIAGSGRVIVSGMAYGIDAAAHRGALMATEPTIALIASGIDIPYPTSNANLMAAIMARGVVLTEAPPGSRPMKVSFLARNRLIAALSEGLLVVEANPRSGAKNTAGWANRLGRIVMAVPGPVTATQSVTPNRLIRDQEAIAVGSWQEVLALLDPLSPQDELPLRGRDTRFDELPQSCKELREAIAVGEEVSAAELSVRTGLSIPRCLAGLDELAEGGWLEEAPQGGWRLPLRPR